VCHRAAGRVTDGALAQIPPRCAPLPYESGQLDDILKTYRRLRTDNRLVVPAQVVREFVDHRSKKLVEACKALTERASKDLGNPPALPFLAGHRAMKALQRAEAKLKPAYKAYQANLKACAEVIRGYTWNGPVSEAYGKILDGIVVDHDLSANDLANQLDSRIAVKRPPGYKDCAKDDQGVGDIAVWMTILKVGMTRKVDLLFVSDELKADWWHRVSDRDTLYPRFELVDEYASACRCAFSICTLSQLLTYAKASASTVGAVAMAERQVVVGRRRNQPSVARGDYALRGFGDVQRVALRIKRHGHGLVHMEIHDPDSPVPASMVAVDSRLHLRHLQAALLDGTIAYMQKNRSRHSPRVSIDFSPGRL
jgi:hypothetical protein